MTLNALFRSEVYSNTNVSEYGVPLAVGNATLKKLAIGSVLVLFVLCIAALSFPYSQKLKATGVIISSSGVTRVIVSQQGTLVRTFVKDGEDVREGQSLFEMTSDLRIPSAVSASDSAILALRERSKIAQEEHRRSSSFDKVKLENLQTREQQYLREKSSIYEQIENQDERLIAGLTQLARDEKLVNEGHLPKSSLIARTDAVMELKQKKAELERLALVNERERSALRVEIEELKGKPVQSRHELENTLQILMQEERVNEARKSVLIVASKAGKFEGLAAVEGNFLTEGQALGAIVSTQSTARADIFIPAFASAFPTVGMPASVSVKAFPFQNFGLLSGRIAAINSVAIAGRELVHLPVKLEPDQLYFRASIELPGIATFESKLTNGMAVDAVVKIEEKPLFKWLFQTASQATRRVLN